MRLEQMRAIAADLGQPPGELPPLAGGGGVWQLFVPATSVKTASVAVPAGVPTIAAVVKLFGGDNTPQILQRWLFTNLTIPGFVSLELAEAPTSKSNAVSATLLIRRNSDIIATVPGTQTGVQLSAGGEKQWFTNFIFAADFTNPLPLARGQYLVLEMIVVSEHATAAEGITMGLSEETTTTATLTNRQGTLTYSVQDLSGHRVLA